MTEETVTTTGASETEGITYDGVVLSDDRRVAGTLTVRLTRTRQIGRARAAYAGRITVEPDALQGTGAWQGGFAGDLRGDRVRQDLSAIGRELIHNRTVAVRRNPAAIRTAGRAPTRVVRRVLRGTGDLAGMRLAFDYVANVDPPPPVHALPTGCLADYERWTGVILRRQ